MIRQGLFRPPESGDVRYIAERMRQADRDEVFAVRGEVNLVSVVADAVLRSSMCWTGITLEREPVCIFGVVPVSLLTGQGSPWMLSTEKVFRFPGALVRETSRYLERMLGVYPHLENYVDARNVRSVRWLTRVGFTVHPPQPYGAAGLPFHRFEMKA